MTPNAASWTLALVSSGLFMLFIRLFTFDEFLNRLRMEVCTFTLRSWFHLCSFALLLIFAHVNMCLCIHSYHVSRSHSALTGQTEGGGTRARIRPGTQIESCTCFYNEGEVHFAPMYSLAGTKDRASCQDSGWRDQPPAQECTSARLSHLISAYLAICLISPNLAFSISIHFPYEI